MIHLFIYNNNLLLTFFWRNLFNILLCYNFYNINIYISTTFSNWIEHITKLHLLFQLNKFRAQYRTVLPPWVSQETSYERWRRIGIQVEIEKRKRLDEEWEENRREYLKIKEERKLQGQLRKKVVIQEIFR